MSELFHEEVPFRSETYLIDILDVPIFKIRSVETEGDYYIEKADRRFRDGYGMVRVKMKHDSPRISLDLSLQIKSIPVIRMGDIFISDSGIRFYVSHVQDNITLLDIIDPFITAPFSLPKSISLVGNTHL